MKGQLKELTSGKYGKVGIMWFDGEWEGTWTHEMGKDLYDYCRALDADIIVNNRVDTGRSGMEGITREGDYRGDDAGDCNYASHKPCDNDATMIPTSRMWTPPRVPRNENSPQ
ncbi:MAG: hypothetical protein ACKPKO_46160, partial [Candidatus Fonsibacter sp.]